METITRDELKGLAGQEHELCVSIYLPTHRAGMETQQGPIRLKNLLRKAEGLRPRSIRPSEFRALIEPAKKLANDALFWQHQDDGLALFLSPKGFLSYRLPIHFPEQIVLGRHFNIKPLLPLFAADGHYFILAVSQNQVRLLQCSRYGSGRIDIPSMPDSIGEALRFDEPEKQLQFHTKTSPMSGEGRRRAMFHGHGVGTDDEKTNLLRYFQQIDKSLHERLRDEHAPLVVAGVGYLFPIFREANTYPYLLDEGIEGNPEEMSEEDLKSRSWEVVRPHFTRDQREAAEKYRLLISTQSGRASDDPAKVVPAAYGGRVDTLFVAVGDHRWGTFDTRSMEVDLHEEHQEGDEDLLDIAAVQTFLNGGNVYEYGTGAVPSGGSLAAILRY